MTSEEAIKKLEEVSEEVFQLELEYHQLKNDVIVILHQTLAGSNGAYTSEFGPVTLGRLLKITGFNMNDRFIIKRGYGCDAERTMNKNQLLFFNNWFNDQEDRAYLKGEHKWIGVTEKELIELINKLKLNGSYR